MGGTASPAHLELRLVHWYVQDFKPEFVHWKLVILFRKLLFATLVVLLNSNVSAQVRCDLG